MKATDWAWLAGIIDGEGYVGVTRVQHRNRAYPYYEPRIEIVMTHEETMQRVGALCGRRVLTLRQRQAHHKQAWCVAVGGKQVAMVLRSVLPYLTTKRQRAEAVIQFMVQTRRSDRWHPITEAELAERHRLWQEVR